MGKLLACWYCLFITGVVVLVLLMIAVVVGRGSKFVVVMSPPPAAVHFMVLLFRGAVQFVSRAALRKSRYLTLPAFFFETETILIAMKIVCH